MHVCAIRKTLKKIEGGEYQASYSGQYQNNVDSKLNHCKADPVLMGLPY